ncbi:MAG TPA: hypothetical protein VGG04_02455 [Candidatus Sulfotelmatobacter sp.]|jgi:hypothetical protein
MRVDLSLRLKLAALSLILFSCAAALASSFPVHYKEGLLHGFLLLSTTEGTPLAAGDVTQLAQGDKVTMHMVFHFKDGSLQDETTVFSQRNTFSLISYHLIQKGPTFPHSTEMTVAPSTGQVTVRYTDDKGEEKVESEKMKLPPDLANGLIPTLLKNLPVGTTPPAMSMVVATPKPRVVKLSFNSEGAQPFSLAGASREATHYVAKVEIGGVAGVVAPLVGKQPPDAHIWILGGEAPTFVKSETSSYMGGPVWRMEMLSPTWPKSAKTEAKKQPEEKQ